MASQLFATLFRRAPQVPGANAIKFPFTAETNPYRSKRTWPPDFTKLSQKHQFRLERRYRRRTKLKWARPTWKKVTKLTQWGSILFVVVYGVGWLDMSGGREGEGDERTVWEEVRRWWAGGEGEGLVERGRRVNGEVVGDGKRDWRRG
ncbi:hypothetical protein LTR36_010684 [Oleoguttula mirabilis]|uniref:Uncharacterized protein n=1 Tax=Oleoguttula mirabilis TaxID=1507867 RepID=A0AAV9JTQ7_9PEZI|nr:hypothetical protein LTR36_010684 [Oleoguttula mirabilis]